MGFESLYERGATWDMFRERRVLWLAPAFFPSPVEKARNEELVQLVLEEKEEAAA